ncbi:hypothetical protein [Sphingobacterium sp. DR205]|uniref:hypothetical protein n=1 Tax=Sphingobacterium sp. DR205 TaxID=2713573 RepID=UPI0013E4179E|nr:hypothetical protein [Sphingobacterium sp. DR205]QIH33437.1 hypothetical protein G6053_11315 [Sphingobacterium sp. DR205]
MSNNPVAWLYVLEEDLHPHVLTANVEKFLESFDYSLSLKNNAKSCIQFLLFPKGLSYNKKTDECRTTRINLLFLYLSYFQ